VLTVGSGVSSADLQTYWSNHHPGSLPAGVTTRWQIYQAEVAGTGDAGIWNAATEALEPHAPVCNLPISTAGVNRRRVPVAIVNCSFWGVQGNSVNHIRTNAYGYFFLTEPVPLTNPDKGNIYVEYIEKHNVDEAGSALHSFVRLVR